LIQAVYSSSNGGKTAANESIWNGDPVPYLRGKNDPHDSISPHSNWRVEIDQNKLHKALSDRYGLSVTALQFRPPHKDGRIREVTRLDKGENTITISGGAFRFVASTPKSQLKSTFFDVEENGNKYRFNGRGFGHGVGLSQWGAHGMALDGSSYSDILAFYYPGTNLARQLSDQPDQNDQRLADVIDADNSITDNIESSQISEFNRVQLGWGGGWVDLHADAVSSNHSALNSEKRSSGEAKSLRRRVAW